MKQTQALPELSHCSQQTKLSKSPVQAVRACVATLAVRGVAKTKSKSVALVLTYTAILDSNLPWEIDCKIFKAAIDILKKRNII